MNIASIEKRFGALVIDILFVSIVSRILLIFSSLLLCWVFQSDFLGRVAIVTIISFMYPPQLLIIPVFFQYNYYLFLLIYLIVFEALYYLIRQIFYEQTLGQKWTKIKVVGVNGEKLTFGSINSRYILKTISNYLFFIPYIMLLFTKNQTLHDKVSGSIVVEHKNL